MSRSPALSMHQPHLSAPDAGVRPTGPVEEFIHRLEASLASGEFVRLVLSTPTANAAPLERILGRLVRLKDRSVLSLSLRTKTRDVTENVAPGEAGPWVRSRLGTHFASALLETTRRNYQLSAPPGGSSKLRTHPPTVRHAPARQHDRVRTRVLDASSRDWLHALGLVDDSGHVLPSRTDKHRQVMRFAEILGHLIAECAWSAGQSLRVVDMGCGRGYLTLATWHLLRRQLGFGADVTGIEARAELVASAQELANRLNLEGLHFIAGTIAESELPPLDVLVALHACDTATDDAVLRGIALGARLVVFAPCCHQQVRPQLGSPEPLGPILRHGVMKERFAEWITDGLRALYLEWAGYHMRLIEFVASEHTPRNLLVTGVLTRPPFTDLRVREEILALKRSFGIVEHPLDALLHTDDPAHPPTAQRCHADPTS